MDILYSGTELIPFVDVLLGNGDGTFRAGFSFNANYLPSGPGSVASTFASDFNGDGRPVLWGGYANLPRPGGWYVYFIEPGTSVAPDNCAYLVTVADVNHDGKPDLVCGASVMLGAGDGTFRAAQQVFSGTAVLVADFNRDGNPTSWWSAHPVN